MNDPLTCPLCGGRRPAYRSVRSLRFVTQYRRCESCEGTSKTRRWLNPEPKRLTPNQAEELRSVLPDVVPSGIDTSEWQVFVLVKRRN